MTNDADGEVDTKEDDNGDNEIGDNKMMSISILSSFARHQTQEINATT